MGANYLQAFVNSRKEYGFAYKVKVSDSATLNLGLSSYESFFKIILPSARPAIVVGLSLVAMETLSDFGKTNPHHHN